MRDFPVFIGILDLAPLDLLHFGMDGRDPLIYSLKLFFGEVHAGKIDLKSGFAVDHGIFVTAVDPQLFVQ